MPRGAGDSVRSATVQDTEKAGRPPFPKIELHVHLEATVRPERLVEIARRNGFELPAETPEGIRELYRYRDFDHFIEVWILTTNALQREEDFRQVVVDYHHLLLQAHCSVPFHPRGARPALSNRNATTVISWSYREKRD